jgi:hypothetical protein
MYRPAYVAGRTAEFRGAFLRILADSPKAGDDPGALWDEPTSMFVPEQPIHDHNPLPW